MDARPQELKRHLVREALTENVTAETLLLARTAYAELHTALAKLSPQEVEAVSRHFGLVGEPETYEAIGASSGKTKSAVAATLRRALWRLHRLLRAAPEPLAPELDAEERDDLRQIANECPPFAFRDEVRRRLVRRGLIRQKERNPDRLPERLNWEATEKGAIVARLVEPNPFRPYRCLCAGKWTACPLCGETYHTHSMSGFWLPPRCKVCRGELDPANDQGLHFTRRRTR